MSTTISPNMNLPVPGVGVEAGPQYAVDVNNCLSLIDQHDHSAGSGVQITPDGLNINNNLTLNSNFLINVGGITLIAQGSTPGISTVYESGVDLFYVDGLGNNVQLTANGGVAGSPGSIANLTSPASAAYVAANKTFVWQSDVTAAANMDAGSLLMRNLSPNSTFALTLQPPAGLSTNYSITLPALPSSQKIMTLDASGDMAAPYTVDGSTIAISSNVIGVPAGGITTTQIANNTIVAGNIANGTITSTQIAAQGIARSNMYHNGQVITSSSGTFSTNSGSFVIPTNLALDITSTGRPVLLSIQWSGVPGENPAFWAVQNSIDSLSQGEITIFNATTSTFVQDWSLSDPPNSPSGLLRRPAAFFVLAFPPAGTTTYQVLVRTPSTNNTLFLQHCVFIAYEL